MGNAKETLARWRRSHVPVIDPCLGALWAHCSDREWVTNGVKLGHEASELTRSQSQRSRRSFDGDVGEVGFFLEPIAQPILLQVGVRPRTAVDLRHR